MWAITFRTRRPDLLPKPVTFIETEAGPQEKLLPERSEAYISYRTKTYPAAYVNRLSWNTYNRMIESDCARATVTKRLKELEAKREIQNYAKSKDRWKEARSYMNWHARTHIMAD